MAYGKCMREGRVEGVYAGRFCCKLRPIGTIHGDGVERLGIMEINKVLRASRGCAVGLALMLGACVSVGQGAGVANFAGSEMASAERALWASGVDAENSHNYELAINAFANLYERRPSDTFVLTALLRNLRYGGRATDAVSYAEQRAKALLADPLVNFEYAKAQLDSGRKIEALNTLRVVAAQMPENWQVHNAIGIAFDSVDQFDDAIVAYQTALKYSPNSAIVMNNLGISQAMAGRLQAAINTLEEAAAINRTNTHIRQNLALLYAANGESEKARALAAMDLDAGDLETNLSFYRRFGGGDTP